MSMHISGVSGDTPSFKRSDNSDPPGVAQERVDSYTLEIVQRLFPRGIQFLALLLRWAIVKQFALPGWPEAVDAAMIQVQSLRVLAKRIGWSYDTVEKYVVVFCALGLLYKARSRTAITLYFPLGRYTPPASLDLLDEIEQDYRPKAQQFARRVRRRFVATFSALAASPAPADASAGVPAPFDLPGTLLVDIERILRDEGIQLAPQQQQRIRIKISGVLRYRCIQGILPTESRLSSEGTGDSLSRKSPESEATGDSWPAPPSQKGRLSQQKGDFVVTMTTRKSRLSRKTGDSSSSPASKESPFLEQKGDFARQVSGRESPLPSERGDFDQHHMLQKGRLFSQTGDSDPKKGDSEVEFAGGTAANVNVITITSTITSNVNLAASFCCKALEEEPAKLPIYQKLFRQVAYDQEAIVAALLYTLAHRRDGTIRNPAAVFTQRCKDYHHSGVPEEAAALVEQYGLLPWVQLLEVLSGPISPKTPASVPATAGRTTFVHQTPALLPPLRPGIRIPARITLKKGGGMTGEEAKRLWSLVAHDRRVALCNKEIIPLSDGTYVLLLDNTVSSTVRQAAFYSEQEWYLRTATLTDCFALFAADCEPLARARRAPRSGGGQA